MAVTGKYLGLDATTLGTMKTETLAAISAAKTRGVGVTQPDIGFQFSPLPELTDELAEIMYALGAKNGTRVSRTIARLS